MLVKIYICVPQNDDNSMMFSLAPKSIVLIEKITSPPKEEVLVFKQNEWTNLLKGKGTKGILKSSWVLRQLQKSFPWWDRKLTHHNAAEQWIIWLLQINFSLSQGSCCNKKKHWSWIIYHKCEEETLIILVCSLKVCILSLTIRRMILKGNHTTRRRNILFLILPNVSQLWFLSVSFILPKTPNSIICFGMPQQRPPNYERKCLLYCVRKGVSALKQDANPIHLWGICCSCLPSLGGWCVIYVFLAFIVYHVCFARHKSGFAF